MWFMSDGHDRLSAEPGHTRPDMCTNQHSRLRCVPAQRWEEVDICHMPYQHTSVAQGRFLAGSGCRAEVHTCLAVPKMPRAPSAFPFLGRFRHQAINLTPLRRVKAWGNDPLRPAVSPVQNHIWPNSLARDGQLKWDLDTGESHTVKREEVSLRVKYGKYLWRR